MLPPLLGRLGALMSQERFASSVYREFSAPVAHDAALSVIFDAKARTGKPNATDALQTCLPTAGEIQAG